MSNAPEPPPLPTDLAAAHALILAERAARLVSEIAVERLKLEVARLRRERFGASSERSARIDQLELVLEGLEETLAETEAQAAEPEAPALRSPPGVSPLVGPSPSSCRASASSIPARRPAPVAVGHACALSARTSPRPWSGSRHAGW